MKYKTLLKRLQKLTPAQLELTVVAEDWQGGLFEIERTAQFGGSVNFDDSEVELTKGQMVLRSGDWE